MLGQLRSTRFYERRDSLSRERVASQTLLALLKFLQVKKESQAK